MYEYGTLLLTNGEGVSKNVDILVGPAVVTS